MASKYESRWKPINYRRCLMLSINDLAQAKKAIDDTVKVFKR